ncbi:MAG: 5-(carboxyamino)imidazole ribonucleotide synthase [Thiotrichaceae bacterium]
MKLKVFSYPLLRIGIIGGGQLGKMTAQTAKRMGFYVTVLDPVPNCPAKQIADVQIEGSLYDPEKLRALAQVSDVITFDVEHIDTQTLKQLHQEGTRIYPSPYLLETIQDKLKQKQVLTQHHVPVSNYQQVDELTAEILATLSFPVVQKARTGGYDGKGVVILNSLADADKILHTPSLLEEYIDFEKELAVMVARTQQGEIACYPVVEMVFDSQTNICDIVAAPAHIAPEIAERAQQVAIQAVEALDGVGIFGVEMFLTRQGQVLVNEIAPRPHNSGHYTIEACTTCQFEQLIRIISELPLGETRLLTPVVMANLLGEIGYTGKPLIEGLETVLTIPGLTFHLYGKEITQPSRKMGHITVIDTELDRALVKIHQAKASLKIKGEVVL